MASSKAIAESGRDGLPIRLKRTNLQYTDTRFSGSDQENKESLNFGEPLYFDSDDTLVIGNASGTAIKDLPIVKFKSDDLAIIADGTNIPSKHKVIKFFDKIKSSLITFFDSIDNSGITRLEDESGNTLYTKEKSWPIISINSNSTYYTINSSDISKLSSTQSDTNSPGCIKIEVKDMLSTYSPCASLYIPNSVLNSQSTIKSLKTAYGRLTQIQTFDGFIIACFTKKPETSFQIALVGG